MNMLNVCGCGQGEGWAMRPTLMFEGVNKVSVGEF